MSETYMERKVQQQAPKREPLSKEEYMSLFIDTYHSENPISDFVRLIEKAHGIGETK